MQRIDRLYRSILEIYFRLTERRHTSFYYFARARGYSQEQSREREMLFEDTMNQYAERSVQIGRQELERIHRMTPQELKEFMSKTK